MNTITLMKKYTDLTLTLLLGAFVVLGLSACAEGDAGEGADTTAMSSDTVGMENNEQAMGGMQDSVSLQSTNQLLQRGITQISSQAAVQNINGWQQKLDGTSLQGEAQQTVSDISNTLGDIKSTLQGGGQIDGGAVGEAFQQLSDQLSTLLQNAQGLNLQSQQQQQLTTMQQAFQQAAQQLMGEGGAM